MSEPTIRDVIAEMQTMARVAGQASVEDGNPLTAAADGRFADCCAKWADRLLAALAAPPDGQEQPEQEDLTRVDGECCPEQPLTAASIVVIRYRHKDGFSTMDDCEDEDLPAGTDRWIEFENNKAVWWERMPVSVTREQADRFVAEGIWIEERLPVAGRESVVPIPDAAPALAPPA